MTASPHPLLIAPGELRVDHLRLFTPNPGAPIELLLAAPGLLGAAWPEVDALARNPGASPTAAAAFSYRSAALAFFARQLDAVPHDAAWEEAIMAWRTALADESLRVFHDRHQAAFTRLVSRATDSLVLHAPLLLDAPPADQELDLVLTGDRHAAARAWFRRRRDRADDISAAVADVLAGCWSGDLLTPEDLYLKVLAEYFSSTLDGMDIGSDDNELLPVMTEFQREAYFHAKGILRRFGGVFLADVVGLGKTFIAMALLRHLQEHYRQHAVIVAPPAILPAWRELAAEFRVELQYVSFGKLDALDDLRDREVLVIDESHNFRNPRTQRQERLSRWLRPDGAAATRRVILLSATPQNTRPRDVYEQIKMFPDTFSRLPIEAESLLDFFRGVERGEQSMIRLLQHIVVRRTRRFIRSAYPTARLRRRVAAGEYREEPLVFPTRISGPAQCLRYLIDHTYPGGLYDQVLAALATLNMPRQNLSAYIRHECVDDPRVQNIRRSHGLRGLFKVLLLKRVESSVEALRLTLSRTAQRLETMRAELAGGHVRVLSEPSDPAGDLDAGDDDEVLVPASLFRVEDLRLHLHQDLWLLAGLREGLDRIEPAEDAKLVRLRRYLQARPPGAHKILVFTQFADTAEYLGRNLASVGKMAVATGARGGALALARRFAPSANRATMREGEEIDLLITTDVLSEGVNLQDGDTIINYDLHWNPVRLIQRAGRIDRLGSTHDEIHIASFLPERSLEDRLGLEAVLRARIDDFIHVFGEDYHVLPQEERLEEQEIVDAYTGRALERSEADDDMDGLSRHIERILQLRREDPDRYTVIRSLRLGRRSVSAGRGPGIAAMRLGPSWRFYLGADGGVEVVDDCAGLDQIYKHSDRPPTSPPTPAALAALRALATTARATFEPVAQLIRTRAMQPALDAAERWVQAQLEALRAASPTLRHPPIDRAAAWILRGQHKHLFQRDARRWKHQRLSPASVLDEMLRLIRQFPIETDDLSGSVELVGVLVPEQMDDMAPALPPSAKKDVDALPV